MSTPDYEFAPVFVDHRGGRQHRYMESADIRAAFRELFRPLRANIRRGMRNRGQFYALEMDTCIPGELLATVWIPLVARGIDDPSSLADASLRRAHFDRLLAEQRPEALFACIRERSSEDGPVLCVEVVSADACYAAEYPILRGRGWHLRALARAPHRRVDPVTRV